MGAPRDLGAVRAVDLHLGPVVGRDGAQDVGQGEHGVVVGVDLGHRGRDREDGPRPGRDARVLVEGVVDRGVVDHPPPVVVEVDQ